MVKDASMSPSASLTTGDRSVDQYLTDVLGCPCDQASVVELDSNSPTKFSKHIIVKKWNVLVSV